MRASTRAAREKRAASRRAQRAQLGAAALPPLAPRFTSAFAIPPLRYIDAFPRVLRIPRGFYLSRPDRGRWNCMNGAKATCCDEGPAYAVRSTLLIASQRRLLRALGPRAATGRIGPGAAPEGLSAPKNRGAISCTSHASLPSAGQRRAGHYSRLRPLCNRDTVRSTPALNLVTRHVCRGRES